MKKILLTAAMFSLAVFAQASPDRTNSMYIGSEATTPAAMTDSGDFGIQGHMYNVTAVIGKRDHWENLPAKSSTSISGASGITITTATIVGGAFGYLSGNFTQPAAPRSISVYFDDANANLSTATVILTGRNGHGDVITESITACKDTSTNFTNNAFARLDTLTGVFTSSAPAATVNMKLGNGDKIGFIGKIVAVNDAWKFVETYVDQSTSTYTTSATYNTTKPTNAPNGTIDYDFYYMSVLDK